MDHSLPDTQPPQTTAPSTGAWVVDDSLDDVVILLSKTAAAAPSPNGDWRDRLARPIRTVRNVAVVGAKRLAADRSVFSMGEMVVHPKGFHHLGATLPREAMQFVEEVDAVTGGVLAVSRAWLARAGEVSSAFDALLACLRVRIAGGRVLVAPDVEVVDDTPFAATLEEDAAFEVSFGFDWRAADLDSVIRTHAGTGLLWNARFTATRPVRYRKYVNRPMLHWRMYEESPLYRSRAEAITNFLTSGLKPGTRVLDLGCGDGLFTHLFASRGMRMLGADIEPEAIEQAKQATEAIAYPRDGTIQFEMIKPGTMPAGPFEGVLLIDVIEHLPNPSATLRRARQHLAPGGLLAVVTPEAQHGRWSDAVYHVCEYTHAELISQLEHCGFDVTNSGRVGEPYRDLIVLARPRA